MLRIDHVMGIGSPGKIDAVAAKVRVGAAAVPNGTVRVAQAWARSHCGTTMPLTSAQTSKVSDCPVTAMGRVVLNRKTMVCPAARPCVANVCGVPMA